MEVLPITLIQSSSDAWYGVLSGVFDMMLVVMADITSGGREARYQDDS